MESAKYPLFKIVSWKGGLVTNGDGIRRRFVGIYLFRHFFYFRVCTWKVGKGLVSTQKRK